ncbi:M61 family metallopeptidase [Sphingomonas sabuli]|uniref:M61 family metallopeptidase n=1 Tax=Sphingomonas sabuli TaxID=2764186 RepID=A0A7G9L4V7_9SPHN|nr:PDZ domain-containing protein [Sphingomonas sabuli]QNM83656.1 M61 family metallopeptidase [Sphingomonas sabuli]
MRFRHIPAAVALILAVPAAAQPVSDDGRVNYAIAFPNRAHHEADIAATFTRLPPGPLRIQMARSSPGRYAIHEFAKNVYSVSAADGAGRPLRIVRTDPYGWTVEGHDGTVRFRYTLFANRGDGTYSQVNSAHAHLNIPATFAFAPALANRPVALSIATPDPAWSVATQLIPGREGSWHARDLQYFMDSPIEIAPLRERRWAASEPGRNSVIRLMVHSADSDADLDRYAAMAERIYRAHVALWNDIPNYDGGTYTFLADYQPYASGDGMEHRNSTYIVGTQSLADGKFEQIDTLSHELFHAWNVERLRPAELEPFDFTRANPAPTLWFAEGFTNYYGPLLMRRAGVSGVDRYLKDLGETLTYVTTWPGRRYGSPREMSLRAPFVDAATAIDPVNRSIFTSYYPYGATIALALDLTLRQRGQATLDDMMRLLWRSHGAPERPYTIDDLRLALGTASRDPAFADTFFRESIDGSALPDFAPLLAQAGLTLRPAHPEKPYLAGAALTADKGAVVVRDNPEPGSPLYVAEIGANDRITAVAGKPMATQAAWSKAAAAMKPGQPVAMTVESLGKTRTVMVTPAADPTLEIVRDETIGKTPSAQQLAFRQAWLGDEGSMLPPQEKPAT